MAEAKALVIVPKLDSDKTGCVLQVFPLVQCKDCIHRGWYDEKLKNYEFPDEKCPAQCEDFFYSWRPGDDWFCANGEVKLEAVEPVPPTDESDLWRCGNCNHQLFRCTHQRYCEMCGKAVKWDG